MAKIELRGLKGRFKAKNLEELKTEHNAKVRNEGQNLIVEFDMPDASKDDLAYSQMKAKRANIAWKQL